MIDPDIIKNLVNLGQKAKQEKAKKNKTSNLLDLMKEVYSPPNTTAEEPKLNTYQKSPFTMPAKKLELPGVEQKTSLFDLPAKKPEWAEPEQPDEPPIAEFSQDKKEPEAEDFIYPKDVWNLSSGKSGGRLVGIMERLDTPLYSSSSLSSTTNTFFTNSIGTTDATAPGGVRSQLTDDPWRLGGYLPYPRSFEIHALSMITSFGTPVADQNNIYNLSYLKVFIGTKDYLIVNSNTVTSGVGLVGPTTAVGVTCVQNGRSDCRDSILSLDVPVQLIPQQTFNSQLIFNVDPFPSVPVRIWVYLWGFLKKEVQ